jgi:hypothetical protein
MQAQINYKHNVVLLNKIGAKLTMFDHIPMKSEADPSSGGGNLQLSMDSIRAAQQTKKK